MLWTSSRANRTFLPRPIPRPIVLALKVQLLPRSVTRITAAPSLVAVPSRRTVRQRYLVCTPIHDIILRHCSQAKTVVLRVGAGMPALEPRPSDREHNENEQAVEHEKGDERWREGRPGGVEGGEDGGDGFGV